MTTDPVGPAPTSQRPADDDYGAFPAGMQRASAASGIVFVVLIVVSIFFDPGDWPDYTAAGAEYQQFALDNRDDMQLGQLFGALGLVAFVWFLAHVRGAFTRVEHWMRGYSRLADAFFAGGLVAAVLIGAASATTVTAVSQPDDTDGEVIRAFFHLSDGLWSFAILGFVVMLAAAGIFILRTRAFPVWLAPVALVSALCYLVLFIAGLPNAEDIDDAPLGFIWMPAFLLFVVWIIAMSVLLIRRVGRPWPWAEIRGRTSAGTGL